MNETHLRVTPGRTPAGTRTLFPVSEQTLTAEKLTIGITQRSALAGPARRRGRKGGQKTYAEERSSYRHDRSQLPRYSPSDRWAGYRPR